MVGQPAGCGDQVEGGAGDADIGPGQGGGIEAGGKGEEEAVVVFGQHPRERKVACRYPQHAAREAVELEAGDEQAGCPLPLDQADRVDLGLEPFGHGEKVGGHGRSVVFVEHDHEVLTGPCFAEGCGKGGHYPAELPLLFDTGGPLERGEGRCRDPKHRHLVVKAGTVDLEDCLAGIGIPGHLLGGDGRSRSPRPHDEGVRGLGQSRLVHLDEQIAGHADAGQGPFQVEGVKQPFRVAPGRRAELNEILSASYSGNRKLGGMGQLNEDLGIEVGIDALGPEDDLTGTGMGKAIG